MNLANTITLARLPLLVLIVIIFFVGNAGWRMLAVPLVLLLIVMDAVDGIVARQRVEDGLRIGGRAVVKRQVEHLGLRLRCGCLALRMERTRKEERAGDQQPGQRQAKHTDWMIHQFTNCPFHPTYDCFSTILPSFRRKAMI